jgi:hypothetical protein
MQYAVEMGSGAMMRIPNFIKIGLSIQMLLKRDTLTDRMEIT